MKPACSQCVETDRKCDFRPSISSFPKPMEFDFVPLKDFEVMNLEYFRDVCVTDFSLFFELQSWERIIMQATCAEPCMRHAALSIAALSRSHYLPAESKTIGYPVQSVGGYAMQQYNLAIRKLNIRLDTSIRGWEIAILGAIVFIEIDFLQGDISRIQMHLESAYAILLENSDLECLGLTSCMTDTNGMTPVKSTPNLTYLVNALSQINGQLLSIKSFS